MTDLVDLTVAEAGAALRRGEVSSLQLVDATLQRIEETEPAVHAYVYVYDEEARDAARERDRELARGRWRGPLHGVPVAIKDLLYTTDAPTEAGSEAMRGFMPSFDAAVVDRLHDAGAVIAGKTVTHELAYGVNAPPTRSPWCEDCYPGGSSAGSGAAVAARSAFAAIGTDTGGSIREPAALNGLVGLKPTFGRVSRFGVVPLSPSLDHVGPMTRTVIDNAVLLGAIAGYDRRDRGSIDEPVPDYLEGIDTGVRGLRIGVERDFFFGTRMRPEVAAAADSVIGDLVAAGAEIVPVVMPELIAMGATGLTILLAEASAEHRQLLRTRGDCLDPATRVMLELGELLPATHYVQALRARASLTVLTRRLFTAEGLDALLSPTVPTTTAPMGEIEHAGVDEEDPTATAIGLTFVANVTGLPAISFPGGFSSNRLPIGVQLMGRPFAERTLYRLVRAYERNHDWVSRKPTLHNGGKDADQ